MSKVHRGRVSTFIVIALTIFYSVSATAQADTPVPPAISHFSNWAHQYTNGLKQSAAGGDEGVQLAKERRDALRELIRSNPKQAIEQSVNDDLRAALPKAVAEQLEIKVSGQARFEVLAGIPMPEKFAPAIVRKVVLDGKKYGAFVYGKLAHMTSRTEVGLSGIAVDDVIALDETFLEETPAAQSDISESPATEGIKRLLLIRVDFSDFQGLFFPTTEATNQVIELNNFFSTSSYGRAGWRLIGAGSDVTPLLRMPKLSHLYVDDFTLLVDDARSVAAAAGYNTNLYDYYVVCFPGLSPGYPYCGQGRVGETGAIVTCFSTGIFAHELGHNYGLWHANFWDTSGQSIIGPGVSIEYGDGFDTMGSASAGIYHFNARYKNLLNWIRGNEMISATTNGTYRIKAHDDAATTGVRALRIVGNAGTNYWVEFRQQFADNKWLMNGVGLRWGFSSNEPSHLMDTTPGSNFDREDSALVVGRTFSDTAAGIHITALRKAGTIPETFDVVVNRGAFPGNVAPNVTITMVSTNVLGGTPVTLQASATDANGDALAYYWDFGDSDFGTNGAVQTHVWQYGSVYPVTCIVSDMKGGTKTNSISVNVGFLPIIYEQPRHQTIVAGGTATFSVGALNEPNFYFWKRNGTNIVGATNSTFSIANAQAANVGQYSVVVSNAFGSVTSSIVQLLIGQMRSFSNSGLISIPLDAPATPYPSTLFISGVTQNVLKVTLTLNQLSHANPADLDILLVNPAGNAALVMSDCVIGNSAANITFTLDDEAQFPLPEFGVLASDIYRPANYDSFDTFGVPAPPPPYSAPLASLATGVLNGTWSLFVSDDSPFFDGQIAGGWTLNFIVGNNVPPVIKTPPASRTIFTGYNVSLSAQIIGSPTLRYQWRRNNVNIAGATNATYTITNIQVGHAGIYSLFVTNSFGTATSANAVLTVLTHIPIGEAVDGPGLAWNSGGGAQWFGQSNVTHNSSDAGASGTLNHLEESWLETVVTGPGTLTFWWKVSSEPFYDPLQFLINDVEQQRISGEVDWEQHVFSLGAGTQTFRWRYSKDFIVAVGADRGWLDKIFFTPGGTAPSISIQPLGQSVVQESFASFFVTGHGTPPLRYQWRKNNSDLSSETNANVFISNAQPGDNGNYTVVLVNDYGSATSSNAPLLVLPNLFYDDFEPGIDETQWSQFGGEVQATNYGGSVSGLNSLWFNGATSRFATTRPLRLVAGGTLQFNLIFALGFEFPWESLDLPEEGIVVEFSLDGTNWTELVRFDFGQYFNWTSVHVALPAEANSSGTVFRWRQLSHSGAGVDHWALDDVQITAPSFGFNTLQQNGGNISFLLAGPWGQSCAIQMSTNLTTWTTVNTTVLTNGLAAFEATISPGQPSRFYRATLVP